MQIEINTLTEVFRRRFKREDGWEVFVNWPRDARGALTSNLPLFLKEEHPDWLVQNPTAAGGSVSFNFIDANGIKLPPDQITSRIAPYGWSGEMILMMEGEPLIIQNILRPGERGLNATTFFAYKKEKVLIPETDQAVTFWENGSVDFHTRVPYRQVLVDGLGIGDVGESVLRDRQTLSQNGVVVVTMLVASDTTGLAQPPLITTRGFVFEKQSGGVIQGIEKITSDTFTKARSQPINLDFVRQQVQAAVEVYIYKETGREPMVLPLITRV